MQKKPTAGIIMAAGQSIRYGQPKQLIYLKGRPLIRRIMETALKSKLDKCILVLGFEHQKITAALGKLARNQKIHRALRLSHCALQKRRCLGQIRRKVAEPTRDLRHGSAKDEGNGGGLSGR